MKKTKAPKKVRGNSLSLIGMTAALNEASNHVDGNRDVTESAVFAGKMTLQDKRIVDVGVFVRVTEKKGE